MQISRSSNPHELIGYYPLTNGKVDVFLRRNETVKVEIDDNGNENTVYMAEEIHFQVDQTISKEQIESTFEQLWNDVENPKVELTETEKLKTQLDAVQGALDFIIMNY